MIGLINWHLNAEQSYGNNNCKIAIENCILFKKICKKKKSELKYGHETCFFDVGAGHIIIGDPLLD